MKIILSLIICIICQYFISIGGQFDNMQKPIFRYIHYTNGKANFFFDSKLLKERIMQRTIEKKSMENESGKIQLEIFPNPVSKNAKISFNLLSNSDVKIYTYDNYYSKKNLFEGSLNQGTQEFSFDLDEVSKGLVLFYVEIDGKIYKSKAIKI